MPDVSNFQRATRQNWLKLPTKSFSAGDMIQFDLPRVGLLSSIYLMLKGSVVVTPGTGTVTQNDNTDGKPFNLFKEVRVKINSGVTVVKSSGYLLYLHNLLQRRSLFPDLVTGHEVSALARPFAWSGNTSGTNDVRFMLKVPIAVNDRDPLGLLLLGTSDTTVTVEIDTAIASDIFALTGNATVSFSGLQVVPMIETFSVPMRAEDRPALDSVHALMQQNYEIPTVGENAYKMERGNIYTRLINRAVINGARAAETDITALQIRYNGTQYPYQAVDADTLLAIQRYRYGRDLPRGVFVWDFTDQGAPSYGSTRDWLNSGALTEFEELVTVDSGTTLGSNNNKLEVLREVIIPIAG